MRDARVLARPRRRADPAVEDDGAGKVGWDGDRFVDESELNDCDLEDMGTVKLLRLTGLNSGLPVCATIVVSPALCESSDGTSSGGGIGIPLAAATNWFSVQEFE